MKTSQNTKSYVYEIDLKKRNRYYRHVSKGGWPFSTSAHGWPISDCTAEGLKAILNLHKDPIISNHLISNGRSKTHNTIIINPERLYNAVNVLLTLQNPALLMGKPSSKIKNDPQAPEPVSTGDLKEIKLS